MLCTFNKKEISTHLTKQTKEAVLCSFFLLLLQLFFLIFGPFHSLFYLYTYFIYHSTWSDMHGWAPENLALVLSK